MNRDTLKMAITNSSKQYKNCQRIKRKRYRSAFTTEQINYLEHEFKKSSYITSENRQKVANFLNIYERTVKIWFQNRRMKEKREKSDNKELLIEHENNNSNKQENSQNVYIRHDCAIQEQLLRSQYKNENLTRLNTETRQPNYTSNNNIDLLNQIHVEYLKNFNVSDNKRNSTNETMSVVPILGKNDDIAKNMIEHENNNSNKQENSQNVYIRHDCAIQEQLLRSQYKNENLKRLNTETRQTNYTSNKNTDLLNQIHVEYLNNYNASDNKRNSTNETMSVVPILGKNDDIAKNISSSNIQAEQKVYGQLYPEHLSYDPKLTSLFNQPVATNPANHSSNVVWKPVNVVPVLPGLASPSTVTINNNSSIYLNNQDVSRGIFNFHSAPDMLSAGTQYVPRMHPQYVLAYPFSGSSD